MGFCIRNAGIGTVISDCTVPVLPIPELKARSFQFLRKEKSQVLPIIIFFLIGDSYPVV
jgi:hypothetical protein